MQAVMNLVWDKLLPAMKPSRLPQDDKSRRKLEAKLASLRMRLPSGQSPTSLSATVSGKWHEFAENDRGIQAIALEFASGSATLVVRSAGGESRTQIGIGAWAKNRDGFANGLERSLGMPSRPLIAASGAWTAGDVFTIKLVAYESPFTSTLTFRFAGDQLVFDSEHNVAFGPTKLAQLVGKRVAADRIVR